MLRTVDSRVTPDLLNALARMGHGDEIAVVDANFPSEAIATRPVIQMAGFSAPEVAGMVVSLIPLDTFADDPCLRMEVIGDKDRWEPVQREVQAAIETFADGNYRLESIERFEFYTRARKAYAVVRTGERRFYGCFLFRKGVLAPPVTQDTA